VVVASYPLSSQAPTPVEVELGCDNIVKCVILIKIDVMFNNFTSNATLEVELSRPSRRGYLRNISWAGVVGAQGVWIESVKHWDWVYRK
jgi:hypothetical protein